MSRSLTDEEFAAFQRAAELVGVELHIEIDEALAVAEPDISPEEMAARFGAIAESFARLAVAVNGMAALVVGDEVPTLRHAVYRIGLTTH